jgi:hypothetical protein
MQSSLHPECKELCIWCNFVCMEMVDALELLGGYTAEQWGLVTARQAQALGVDGVTLHRLKKAGFLDAARHGVYAITSATISSACDEQAVWLALRPGVPGWERPKLDPDGGVLSHRSAARLHQLGDVVTDRIEVTVPRRRTTIDPDVWLRKATLTDADVTLVDGLPVTTALRTVCDLLEQRTDASHMATIIRQGVQTGQLRLDELAERLGPYARRYGVRTLDGEALLEDLLAQIGLSIAELTERPSPLGWYQVAQHHGARELAAVAGRAAAAGVSEDMRRIVDTMTPGLVAIAGLKDDAMHSIAVATPAISALSDMSDEVKRVVAATGAGLATAAGLEELRHIAVTTEIDKLRYSIASLAAGQQEGLEPVVAMAAALSNNWQAITQRAAPSKEQLLHAFPTANVVSADQPPADR